MLIAREPGSCSHTGILIAVLCICERQWPHFVTTCGGFGGAFQCGKLKFQERCEKAGKRGKNNCLRGWMSPRLGSVGFTTLRLQDLLSFKTAELGQSGGCGHPPLLKCCPMPRGAPGTPCRAPCGWGVLLPPPVLAKEGTSELRLLSRKVDFLFYHSVFIWRGEAVGAGLGAAHLGECWFADPASSPKYGICISLMHGSEKAALVNCRRISTSADCLCLSWQGTTSTL